MALKARSLNQWKVLCQLNRVGRNCDIHPTAYVEASTIGDNVKIGAGAIIRESLVGSGTFIGNNATLELTVVGEESYIGNSSRTQYCVLYPGSFFIARGMSCSMCGRDSFIGGGAVLSDFRFDGKNITVIKDGAQIDTGNSFIGSCLGHGVYLAAGSIVAPGRTIPNGIRLAPEESRIIRRCDAGRDVPGYRQIDAII
jgi:NDP-sugar pyrophosphorylase family protein